MGSPKGSEKKRAADRAYYAKTRDKQKAYREANREKRKAQSRAWYAKNKAHALDYAKTYAAEHQEEIRAYQKQRYEADPEKYRAYSRASYAKNPQKYKDYARVYYRANRADVLQWAKQYAARNAERIRAYNRSRRGILNAQRRQRRAEYPEKTHAADQRWRDKARVALRAYQKQWNAANPERTSARYARYKRAHPQKVAEWNQHRRARKLHAPRNDLTNAQWSAILHHYHYRCVYCPPKCKACRNQTHQLTQDHIQPLSQGGAHTVSNVVPACRSCNARKHTGPPPRPVQPLLFALPA